MNVSRALLRWRFTRFLCLLGAVVGVSIGGQSSASAGTISVISLGAPSPQVTGQPFQVNLTMQSSGASNGICIQVLTGVSGGTVTFTGARNKCVGNLVDGQMVTVPWTVTFNLASGQTSGTLNFSVFVAWDTGSFSSSAPPISIIAAASPAQLSLL